MRLNYVIYGDSTTPGLTTTTPFKAPTETTNHVYCVLVSVIICIILQFFMTVGICACVCYCPLVWRRVNRRRPDGDTQEEHSDNQPKPPGSNPNITKKNNTVIQNQNQLNPIKQLKKTDGINLNSSKICISQTTDQFIV